MVELDRFEAAVQRAIAGLPDEIRAHIDNVAIAVGERNEAEPDIYGLYTGTPLTERYLGDTATGRPDQIEIYRDPLVADFGHDPVRLEREIRVTVLHELGHYFGIGEERLAELGWD